MGTAGTNYYATQYGYDADGRRTACSLPTGTIDRTVYDGLGGVVSTWVGTNDTPASGDWSPTNNTGPSNMVEVTADVYDGGGVGDGNLTQETALPRRQRGQPRDRLLLRLARPAGGHQGRRADAAKIDHASADHLLHLDNLDEVTETQQYDGDGVTISTSGGVPQAPVLVLLRARRRSRPTTIRAASTRRRYYDVNPSTRRRFDLRLDHELLLRPSRRSDRGVRSGRPGDQGQLRRRRLGDEDVHDRRRRRHDLGGRRQRHRRRRAGAGASTVYDADGNVILTTTAQRDHDETATGRAGQRRPPTPKARVYYEADYYDAANRLTADVDVGTNGGSSLHAAVQRAHRFGHGAGDQLHLQRGRATSIRRLDPRGIVDTRTYYDALGRVTETIQDYTDGTADRRHQQDDRVHLRRRRTHV